MEYLNGAARVVVKIGSSLLVDDKTGSIRSDWLQSLSEDIRDMQSKGLEVVIVSSGSIALGRKVLSWSEKSLSLEQSQASAAVGQIQLAQAYQEALAQYGIRTAQILVTLEDSKDIRSLALNNKIPYYTTSRGIIATIHSLKENSGGKISVRAIQKYHSQLITG